MFEATITISVLYFVVLYASHSSFPVAAKQVEKLVVHSDFNSKWVWFENEVDVATT